MNRPKRGAEASSSPDQDGFLTPPHSVPMEMAALGSMMLSGKARVSLKEHLSVQDFFRPAHQRIFQSLCLLPDKVGGDDLVLLREKIDSCGWLSECGGDSYLVEVATNVPSAAHADHYSECLRVYRGRRELLARAQREMAAALNLEEDPATLVSAAISWSTNGKVAKFRRFRQSDLRELPAIDWLIDGLLPKGGIGMIYGPPGNGKTFVVIDLCCACARGCFLWAKEFGIKGPYQVVYAAGEKFHGIPQRAATACKKWGLTEVEELRFDVVAGVPQLLRQDGDDSVAKFIDELREFYPDGFDLLVIDTLHAATLGADEISGKDTGFSIDQATKIRAAFGCAIIVVHHTNAGASRERGHTAWRGTSEMMLLVEKVPDTDFNMTVKVEKVADGPDGFSLGARRVFVKDASSCAVEWDGRTEAVASDVKSECLKILKQAAAIGMGVLDAKQVQSSFTIDGTGPAIAKALNRLAASGPAKTGVVRTESNPGKPLGTANRYLFKYDESLIEKQQPAPAAYKDSDDAEEIPPKEIPEIEDAYDPFADEE